MKQAILVWIVLMSIISFVVYGIDKQCAIKEKWRIKESTLILLGFIGGGIGSFIGMKVFHHKTLKKEFQILVPVSMILWIVLVIVVLLR